jgi:hypothetical protein
MARNEHVRKAPLPGQLNGRFIVGIGIAGLGRFIGRGDTSRHIFRSTACAARARR